MRIVTSGQMADLDRATIEAGTPGLELMERAGRGICEVLDAGGWLDGGDPVLVVCGKGNNGGDGLVIARLLAEAGLPCRVLLLAPRDQLSADARANLDRLPRAVALHQEPAEAWPARLRELAAGCGLLVDAILGTGITLPLREPYTGLLATLAELDVPIAAVDMPTGVSGDDGAADPLAVTADITITMALPKLGLLLPPGRDHVGELHVVDIGIDDALVQATTPPRDVLPLPAYRALLPARPGDAHKYDLGGLLTVAGSRAYCGAATLCGLGALRAGVGLLTMLVPEGLEGALRVSLPEAILRVLPATTTGTLAPVMVQDEDDLLWKKTALAIGPGLGTDRQTDGWVCRLVERCALPLVLDADGLGAFARLHRTPTFAADQVVLTPHAGELARLLGVTADEVMARRFDLVPELAVRWQAVLLLKGSPTVIGTPDGHVHINPSGDDTLARGGTGDVLTGVIGSLLAQGCSARDAALLGALVHGLAGQAAAASTGRRGTLSREVADAVAVVLAELEGSA